MARGMTIPELAPERLAHTRRRFIGDGYVVLPAVVPAEKLATLTSDLQEQYRSQRASGALFDGGGNLNGHLNCFPGAGSRFVWDALRDAGVVGFVQSLSSTPLRQPNIGCNLNLPGSRAQNEHVDGYAGAPFLIVNVAAVDTDLENGATELMPGTHALSPKYWQIVLSPRIRTRPKLRQGDVVVRVSTLWHRGMPNRTSEPRPMLAFTWEDGGSMQTDPYSAYEGRIRFLPNRFGTDWKGRLIERAFVTAPRLGTAYHIARSFFA